MAAHRRAGISVPRKVCDERGEGETVWVLGVHTAVDLGEDGGKDELGVG